MMKPTQHLRFEKRYDIFDMHSYRILQQQWIDDDPPDEGASRYEWRDVPEIEAPETLQRRRLRMQEEVKRPIFPWSRRAKRQPDLSSVEKRNAFYGSEEYRNMTTAEKCAVQGDGFLNDYD